MEKIFEIQTRVMSWTNSSLALSMGAVAAIGIIAYGFYISYGAGQQLKELASLSFSTLQADFNKVLNDFVNELQRAGASQARINGAYRRLEISANAAKAKLERAVQTARQHHETALKMKGRAEMARNVAIIGASLATVGAFSAGAGAVKAGVTAVNAVRSFFWASKAYAGVAVLFMGGVASCEYGSRQCELVIKECQRVVDQMSDIRSTFDRQLETAMEELEVAME